jgi:hypothetical protein
VGARLSTSPAFFAFSLRSQPPDLQDVPRTIAGFTGYLSFPYGPRMFIGNPGDFRLEAGSGKGIAEEPK